MNGPTNLAQGSAGTARLKVGETAGGAPFEVPPEIATEASVFFGRRGTGKTYTASVVVEELLGRGQQVIVIDPTDVWWGLRSSADGRDEGFPIAVLGGSNGDLPLEEADAYDLADFAVEQRASLILSLRHLRPRDRDRFVTRFSDQLYHRKGEVEHRTPLLVVFDEARLFAPQKVSRKGQADVLEAVEAIVRLGRASGLGAMLVDQRPASVSKDVTSQIETLVCHRLLAPHDRRAVDEWISQHDTEGRRTEFLAVLSSLPKGRAWFWSPALDVFDLVNVRERETYDSSRTPELGESPAASLPAKPADVSRGSAVEALRGLLLTAQANRTEEDEDPDALRRRIGELKSALAKASGSPSGPAPGANRGTEVAGLERKLREAETEKKEAVEAATAPLKERLSFYESTIAGARDHFGRGVAILERATGGNPVGPGGDPGPNSETAPGPGLEASGTRSGAEERSDGGSTVSIAVTTNGESGTRSGEKGATPAAPEPEALAEGTKPAKKQDGRRRILGALAHLEALGISPVPRATLAAYADFKPSKEGGGSGTFRDYLAEMGREGWVLSEGGGVRLNEQGREEAARLGVAYSGPRTLNEFHWRLTERLPEKAARMLRVVIDRHPDGIPREDLAREIGMTTSGTFRGHVANFGRLGLVASKGGRVRATERLFPQGLE